MATPTRPCPYCVRLCSVLRPLAEPAAAPCLLCNSSKEVSSPPRRCLDMPRRWPSPLACKALGFPRRSNKASRHSSPPLRRRSPPRIRCNPAMALRRPTRTALRKQRRRRQTRTALRKQRRRRRIRTALRKQLPVATALRRRSPATALRKHRPVIKIRISSSSNRSSRDTAPRPTRTALRKQRRPANPYGAPQASAANPYGAPRRGAWRVPGSIRSATGRLSSGPGATGIFPGAARRSVRRLSVGAPGLRPAGA